MLVPLACSAGRAQPARPYAVHEIRLGTTLAEFRELARFAELAPEQRLICSDRATPEERKMLSPSVEFIAAGAIVCGISPREADLATTNAGRLEFFGELAEPSFLFFRPAREREPRLVQITFGFDNRSFERVVTLFRRSYGHNTSVEMMTTTLVEGYTVSNVTYTWDNQASTIYLDRYSGRSDRARATFSHTPWWDDLVQAVREARAVR
jgi:hypothetical protein